MSSYRNYTTWNKNTPSSSSNPTVKTESTAALLSKYEKLKPSLLEKTATSTTNTTTKKEEPTVNKDNTNTNVGSTYRTTNSTYGALNTRDRSTGRDASKFGLSSSSKEPEKSTPTTTTPSVRDKYTSGTSTYPGRRDSLTSRTYGKPTTEKKEGPPVSFRGIGRNPTTTGSRSRDPSPAEREKTDNFRLYSRPYTRSTSREPEPVTNPTSTLKYAASKLAQKEQEPKEDIATIASRYGTTIKSKKTETKEDTKSKYGGRTSLSRQESKEDITPKYGGRTSINRQESKEDITPKYGGRTSISRQGSREDIASKYSGRTSLSRQESKEELIPKYGGRSSLSRQESKEELTPQYGASRISRLDTKDDSKTNYGRSASTTGTKSDLSSNLSKYSACRKNSIEDLSSGSPKTYITSRFLPKNTIEKSYTAYSKPVGRSLTAFEERRKRDSLLLQTVLSRQKSNQSSITKEKTPPTPTSPIPRYDFSKREEVVEFETVSVVTRGTSPTPSSQSSYHRTRRTDLAREIQKEITRPKKRGLMVDKEIQSDRMDDTARYSRFSSTSTMSAGSWNSYLDLKYNSPRSTYQNSSNSRYSSSGSRYSKENSPVSRTDDKFSDIKNDTDISRSESISLDLSLDKSSKKSHDSEKGSSESLSSGSKGSTKTQKSTSKSDNKSKEISKKSPPSSLRSEKVKSPSALSSTPLSPRALSPISSNRSQHTSISVNGTPNSSGPLRISSAPSIGTQHSSISGKSRSPTPLSETPLSPTPLSPTPLSTSLSVASLPTDPSIKSKTQPKNKNLTPDTSSKKQLPPLPKSDSQVKTSNSCHSLTTPNKDFRKSVLNMADNKSKKSTKRTNSISSDSEQSNSVSEATNNTDATSISTKLSTSQSLSKIKSSNSLSKLPQKVTISDKSDRGRRSKTRSPSVGSESTDSSSSEDDTQKSSKSLKKSQLQSTNSSRTSMILSADELSLDKPSKPPPSPRTRDGPKNEAEAKSFLMRALAPVTNFFKTRQDSSDRLNLMENNSSENVSGSPKGKASPKLSDKEERRKLIKRIESGERAWWLDENGEIPEGIKKFTITCSQDGDVETGKKLYKFVKQDSGEAPWWLSENADIPEGIEKYSIGSSSPKKSDSRSGSKRNSPDTSSKSNSTGDKKSEFTHPYRIRHIDSGEKAWWMNSIENIPGDADNEEDKEDKISRFNRLWHQQSGEKAWWLLSNPNIPEGIKKLSSSSSESDSDSDKNDEPLGDRASPEGLEASQTETGRLSPYDNVPIKETQEKPKRPTHIPLFISRHTNIDDLLGGSAQLLSPLMDRIMVYQEMAQEQCEEVDATQVKIHDSTAQRPIIQPNRIDVVEGSSKLTSGQGKLDDAALQLYKDGDYSSYLDLEASISEQQEEFEGFETNKKNSIVLRTQLSVRVHTIIEKLLNSEGRELRRALFSLKQIFQEDKDLVHEFVQNDGLACLIKVGSEADQNYQNYILRALGQVMLYVDGMNGVMEHNQTIQWLYTLIASKFRLVVKTALKLLLVFVEYTDSNCLLLIKAVKAVDGSQGLLSWSNIMRLLKDFNSADTELLIYAMTLVNKCLNGIPDQDTYYDQTDALEEQGIEGIIQRYMSKQGTDLDLLQQFQIYEAVLQHEDGEDKGTPLRHLDESIRKTLRNRKSMVDSAERRRSRRHSTGTTPGNVNNNNNNNKSKFYSLQSTVDDEDESSSSQSSGHNDHGLNGSYKENHKVTDAGVTPALRRRRERAERQRSFMREQQESAAIIRASLDNNKPEDTENGNYNNNNNNMQQKISNGNLQLNRNSSRKDLTPLLNAVNKLDSTEEGILKKPWVLSMMYGKSVDGNEEIIDENADNTNEDDRKMIIQLKRENTVKDLTQKLANQNILHSPSEENKVNRIGDMSGLISKAKEGLAKSKSKQDVLKSPTSENVPKIIEVKKSENELRWEELVQCMNRPLNLCDMDFTDLHSEDEIDILAPTMTSNGIPPPPPPLSKDMGAPPPPPLNNRTIGAPPPPPLNNNRTIAPPPFPTTPMFGNNVQKQKLNQEPPKSNTIKKNKKTVKLFWKEVREDPIVLTKLQKLGGMIWDELQAVPIDTQKLEHLFESRAKDLISKKQQEMNKNKEIIVLDHKRSNAINIGMTKLPPPRSIKTAILKMDATIMNREGIEKLLTMLPTEEERTKIQEAQAANPDLPLGSAEQFLITLASISELPARLKLWAFKLDFENSEREIAEPLMDLKQGIEVLKCNKTFRGILSTLLSIGIFLNGNEVKGFQIEYLAKVPEVKDTVHKHSLLHHLCHIVMEKFPEATDLYSEIGAITRASKIDFDELALNIQRLESDCKASWDHLKLIAKHDGSTMMKVKMSDFLADCAERIILLGIVHRRVMNRYHKFLLWLGIPFHRITDSKPNEFCRIVSEFSLEYRTTRERVLQQLEKKANHRERNKTRGKMITEVGKFRTKEDRADAELRQLLGSDISDVESMQGTLPWRRTRRDPNHGLLGVPNGNITDDGDDEILESLVKTATKAPSARTTPRERKRTRHADRKSLRRTLKNGLSEEEKKHIAAYIKGY